MQPYTEGPQPGSDPPPPAGSQEMEVAAAGETYAMPATAGQLRFWSLDQLNKGNPALNMPLMWRCTGPLDARALEHAFTECVRRHEVLRTTFALVEGQLSQIIHPPSALVIPVVDLEGLDGEHLRIRTEELTREHAAFRFDLETGPLLVLKLLRFGPQHHLLLVTMHHIICDGISNGVLLRDMALYYEAQVTGDRAALARLPELPIQFADYAVWQQEWLKGEEPARSLEFWRTSLGNDFSRIALARDEDAVSALTGRRETWTGDIETLLLPADLQARAHLFCRRENVTLNILLFSVFAALLHRLTGQQDLVIGSPCANRTEDTAELVGLFMNIQVMRLRLDDGATFASLLRQVQDWTLGAYENQVLPFENLVHDPFFSQGSASFEMPIFFLYQKSFMVTQRIGELEIVPLRSESPGAVFEIMFAIVDRAEEGPRLQLEYNPRFFKVATVQRTLRLYVNLLASALEEPAGRVDRLAFAGAEEHERALAQASQTHVDFGAFEPVHESFLRLARELPERIALECGPVSWTFRELADYASRLAQRLVAEGGGPGTRIGICMERSPEMVGAVLAVMMAGAAYVPLDPRHPRERLQSVLVDSGAHLLLVSGELGFATSARVLCPEEPPLVAAEAELPRVAADSLAYVIYTSGTTGAPKGVAIAHRSLRNLVCSMQREPGLEAGDVLVAITTLAFDIAALELLLPLVTGAKLVLATAAEVQNGRQLLALMERTRASVLQGTPGAWRILIDAGWTGAQPLKALCGGEALPRGLADRLLERSSEVWNLYGPTETTIWSSATRVRPGTGSLRVGPPIANTQFYVLDKHHAPVPVGVVGELYIGGQGLAHGYWNQPELTAERFPKNPFAPGRMYCTGDLARPHDDGTVELLGRSDFQVKVRGYRIELAEIECALSRHPEVKEAVVAHDTAETTGVTRLTAYVVASTATATQFDRIADELTATLLQVLPEYMIPNAYVLLDELPRNSNGKVDRRALPGVHGSGVESGARAAAAEQEYRAPRDVIERQLADIWQTTLGLPRISVKASFFSLGVGSLAALRLITKMNRIYAMDLGLASLISASTIESIAELIRTRFAPNRSSSLVPLQPNGDRTPLYILHGVGGNVVNFYGLSRRMGEDQPVYGIQSQALVANQSPLLHLKDMAAHYIQDIRKVQPHGPYQLLGYSFGGNVVLEMAHQLRAMGEEVAMLGMIDSKSRDYEEALRGLAPMQTRLNRRVDRFSRNTGGMGWRERAKYISEKVSTRAIRFACMAAARMHFTRVPPFMRSAYDINYVAVQNYTPRRYDGHLILFRASEQDDRNAPHDLGWGPLFSAGVEVHDLTGDHERIFLEPNIDLLALRLRNCLIEQERQHAA